MNTTGITTVTGAVIARLDPERIPAALYRGFRHLSAHTAVVLSAGIFILCTLAGRDAHALYYAGAVGEKHAGNTTASLVCNGEVVGLWVKAGTYVDRLGVLCAAWVRTARGNALGTVTSGPKSPEGASFGFLPGVSSREKTVYCPSGYVMSGIKAQGGDYVDRINSIRCSRYLGRSTDYINEGDVKYISVGMGGSGGSVSRPYCKTGRLVQIYTYTGSWVDRLEVRCD